MISAYDVRDGLLRKLDCSADGHGLADASWIDLLDPTPQQQRLVETALKLEIPRQEKVRSIDTSSQIYREADILFMTARIISRSQDALRLISVVFILGGGKLVTVRFGDPMPFRNFVARAEKETTRLASAEAAMVGLLEAVVDRAAEILESVGDELDTLSTDVFSQDPSVGGVSQQANLRPVMQKIGRSGYLASRVRESLHSLARIVPYLQSHRDGDPGDDIPSRLDTVAHDISSLLDHDDYLLSNVTFLLDATLGLVNIQQNSIIKIFSVAAVIFLPPTLIASIYGMNFKHIPELDWPLGYPYALLLMVSSAVFPYLFARRRGWL